VRVRLGLGIGAAALGFLLLALTVTGCATAAHGRAAAVGGAVDPPATSSQPDPTPTGDPAARAQAQTWLDAAVLPPHAVRTDQKVTTFSSYTGWPCGPYVELEGFWTIHGATVSDTTNWLRLHPPANLITTSIAPIPDDPTNESATVGYIPSLDAQEGIVYTIQKLPDGVAVRAEVAAQTATATCAPIPGGGSWGPPGQG
jgi:hypothetical protein